ncbi:nitroreductase [Bradyrhizobium sp.]|uniref:nitroreductase n=1 Tax=Bradyrhizobium sp. TaxID=376 RepID=UPI002D4516AC|nr:nitroreductase [Bradyrhizobium sp.]HZR72486.1 nitroreductase [Bradyrhizobium sp.]
MNLDKAINGRRAVREYTRDSVSEQTIRGLIDAAIQAPSAVNQQPWGFTIVRNQSLLDRISHEAKVYMLATTPANGLSEQMMLHLRNPEFQIFYHAPALIIISADGPGPWAVEDCALAAQNLMLAAFAANLGSCWIGFAQKFLGTEAGKSLIRCPSPWIPVAPIIIGHPAAPAAPVPRKEPIIKWVD